MLAYLVEVDDRLPEEVTHLVEVPHTDFTEVTRMVLVHVGAVVVLATGETATTGMLPVLADTSMTGRDVAAAVVKMLARCLSADCPRPSPGIGGDLDADEWATYCFRVLVARVGIVSVVVEQCRCHCPFEVMEICERRPRIPCAG